MIAVSQSVELIVAIPSGIILGALGLWLTQRWRGRP